MEAKESTSDPSAGKPYQWNPSPQVYESDPRWQNVDTYAMNHLHPAASVPAQAHLDFALENSSKHGLPSWAVSAAQGKFLMLQARMLDAKRILEVGTLGGYSTIWFANANKHVHVTTVEVNEEWAKVARSNFENAGVAEKISIEIGEALNVLPKLLSEVKAGTHAPFDLVFIDADKWNGWNYFDLAVQMSRHGACVIVDNVVRKGWLVDEEKAKVDKNVQGSRKTVENVGKDARVDAVVMQLVGEKNYDGFLVAVVGMEN